MMIPREYIIVEIIPSHSDSNKGYIVQLQALKIKDQKIIKRLDLRLNDDLVINNDLRNMISYDKELFKYFDNKDTILEEFKVFIEDKPLLIIDNSYTKDYLKDISNPKKSVFKYLELEMSNDIFDKLITKYQLEPSNHFVDLLYEALVFEKKTNKMD